MTRCDITTFDSVEVSDLPYDDEARVQKLILNARPTQHRYTRIPALIRSVWPLFSVILAGRRFVRDRPLLQVPDAQVCASERLGPTNRPTKQGEEPRGPARLR